MLPAATFSISGEVRFYDQKSDSGNVVSRGFCPVCGSPVLNGNSGYPDMRYIHVGSLDDFSVFKPDAGVCSESVQPWDVADSALK